MKMIFAPVAMVFAISGCSQPASEPASESANTAEPATATTAGNAPAAWNQCAICHKAEAGAPNGLGPNLHGIVGQKSGSVAGFSYSPAMKASGITWDEASLDAYIEKPQAKVPGTRMSFAGQADKAKRAEIIAWLKTKN